ncbi:Uma2 family endonuclease [Pseudonocardia lutea]|jgi:Uma2 family endonuclease|uniref:Uma2 family endonuclease n=1 Tax=Pseudonocardia lutea TaxID=2172015 RepID=A0ABW1I6H5_9PSEU
MTLSWPSHPLTLAEWEALPESDEFRLEMSEGMLVMAAKPVSRHQRANARLAAGLDDALPHELIPLVDVEVLLEAVPLTIRAPDVIVTRTALYEQNPPRYSASDVLLAVEILSDGTRRVDRVLKFSEYADAGIPQYWVVDLANPTVLTAYVLVDGDYDLAGEHRGQVTTEVSGVPVTLDLDRLTAR